MTQTTYYKVQWRDGRKPENQWITSHEYLGPQTLEEARKILAKDKAFFYNWVELRLIYVEETTVERHKGLEIP